MNSNIVYLPQQDDLVTISKAELQAIVMQAVQSALGSSKRTHMTKEERSQSLSPYKENGEKKATAAYPLKDPKDIKAVRDYFLSSGDLREYAIFSVGLTLGIRASDLLSLQIQDVFTPSWRYKERLDIIEMKTDKRNKPLLTEYAIEALEQYLSTRKRCSQDSPLFITTQKTSYSLSGYNRKLREAGKALNIRLSSHTMRHTFSYLMSTQSAGTTEEVIDFMSIFVTQMAMNHSSIAQTLSYTGLTQDMMDDRRKAVSSYLMENT